MKATIFHDILTRLAFELGEKISNERLGAYYERLGDKEEIDLRRVCENWKERKFPVPSALAEYLGREKANRLAKQRLEAAAARQREESGLFQSGYSPRDTDSEYHKKLAKDTFRLICLGVDSGDMPGELRKMAETWPKEKWLIDLAGKIEYEQKMAKG